MVILCFYSNVKYIEPNRISYEELNTHNEKILDFDLVDSNTIYSDKNTIVFGSDYQGLNRYMNTMNILKTLKENVKPDLFVFAGDYQTALNDDFYYSERGIYELGNMVKSYFDDVNMLFLQGNHDSAKTCGLAKSGLYNFTNFYLYVINEDDYPWNQQLDNKNSIVIESAKKLDLELERINDKKTVFVVTHVPLHFTSRSNGTDNYYASYIVDVLNKHGSRLNIVYLFGHNHSGNYDDYIGGSINYIVKGDLMRIGGTGDLNNIDFTYLNAGYMGFSNNGKDSISTNELSMTTIKIDSNNMFIQKYTKNGNYYEKDLVVSID